MEKAKDAATLIDLPSQFLDKIIGILAKVGIELPALVLQLFLLALMLLALVVAVRPLLADWPKSNGPPLLIAGAIALVNVGIAFGTVSQALLPDRLIGSVVAQDLRGVRVDLLDFRGQSISTSGSVDTQTGEFIAYYSPAWYGRAHALRISAALCKSHDLIIARSQLGTETTWYFPCDKP